MKLLLEHSGYHLANLGDSAMLAATHLRISRECPGAEMMVPVTDNANLSKVSPQLTPLVDYVDDRDSWISQQTDKAHRWSGGTIGKALRKIRGAQSHSIKTSTLPRELWKTENLRAIDQPWVQHIREADLVIACGGGYFCDDHFFHAQRIALSLAIARAHGIPTALLGQGLGPIVFDETRHVLTQALRGAHAVALREAASGPEIIRTLNLDIPLTVTGDDALGLLPQPLLPDADPPTAMALNIRAAPYAGVSHEIARQICTLVHEIARDHQCELLPIPITTNEGESDLDSLVGLDATPPQPVSYATVTEHVNSTLQALAQARILVTGSYHAALFAAVSGVPVIALAANQYYQGKFTGLAGQFPNHPILICTPDQITRQRIKAVIEQYPVDPARNLDDISRQQDAGQYACSMALSALNARVGD